MVKQTRITDNDFTFIEVNSIVTYIIRELDLQIDGSYLRDSTPDLRERVYNSLCNRLHRKTSFKESSYGKGQ